PKVDSEVCLVRRLVLREARVSVNAEERASARPRVGEEVRADLLESGREGFDEGERRLEQLFFVPLVVGREPLSVVVGTQVGQEREEPGAERGLFRRLCHRLSL